MFTVEQIENAHKKTKTGSDFPSYIREIKEFGVIAFETWVKDSHTEYFGNNGFKIVSQPKYQDVSIADNPNIEQFKHYLKIHQKSQTDYSTFCNHCAETGIEKWIMDLDKMTCAYFDKGGNIVLVENIN